MSRNPSVPLGQVTIRQSELDENSTRYDRLQAAPSDATLETMWLLWAIVSAVITAFVAIVLAAFVSDRRVRKNPFNMYLVYLMIPDILFAGLCMVSCAMNVVKGHFWAEAACHFQAFYQVWAVAANCWLNFFIAKEIHKLLSSSRDMRRYQVPTPKQVGCTALGVYAYAAFIASWGILGSFVSWFPLQNVSISGLGCTPLEYDQKSTIFYFVVYVPCLAMIPLAGAMFIGVDIYRKKLMPKERCKRRLLSLYFFRVVGVYIFMWTPYLILCFGGFGNPLLVFIGGTWGHFQAAISAIVSLTKPDLYVAFRNFVRCKTFVAHTPTTTRPDNHFRLTRQYSSRDFWPAVGFFTSADRGLQNSTDESSFRGFSIYASSRQKGSFDDGLAGVAFKAQPQAQANNIPPLSEFCPNECNSYSNEQELSGFDSLPRQNDDFTFDDEQHQQSQAATKQSNSVVSDGYKPDEHLSADMKSTTDEEEG